MFEHLPETTMSGTNPDGSHYNDPGIKWISYFNGGDAMHDFDRASFGTPQSLGCVELPLAAAAEIWPVHADRHAGHGRNVKLAGRQRQLAGEGLTGGTDPARSPRAGSVSGDCWLPTDAGC